MAANEAEVQQEIDDILANAAERAQIIEQAEHRAEFLDDPVNEYGREFTQGISQMAGVPVDTVNAVLNGVGLGSSDAPIGSGENIQDIFDYFHGAPEGLPTHEAPEGPGAGAARMIGATVPVTAAMILPYRDVMFLDQDQWDLDTQRRYAEFHGTGPGTPGEIPRSRAARAAFILRSIGRDAARFAAENPKTFIAAETAAAGLAGAAGEQAEAMGVEDPAARMAIETGAGLLGGMAPGSIPTMAQNMYRWGMRHILPFTPAGAEIRAAQQMQERAEDPIRAARLALEQLARDLEARDAARAAGQDPDEVGRVLPGRATGERRLMEQEARILEDDPALDRLVREDLEAAINRAELELRNLYDTPRGRENWELTVFQRVAPPGVEIRPGTSEEMLTQLYDAYKPLYEQFRGFPIRPQLFRTDRATTLETMIGNIPQSNRVHASDDRRQAVNRVLQNLWRGLQRRITTNDDGVEIVDSGDLLHFRSRIRDEQRRRSRAGDDESAGLYALAEEAVNRVLGSQLERETLRDWRFVDSYYRQYKLVEDAIWRRSGQDAGLTPDGLLMALKMSATNTGAFARGAEQQMRATAASGRPIAEVLDDPAGVRRRVEGMSAEDLDNTRNDAFHTILQMARVTDPNTGTEGISGARLRQLLNHYDESLRAVRLTDDDFDRINDIAEQLIMMEARSPAAVAELYEDGPSNIAQLLATLVGAKHGQNVAGRGMGSSLVLAQYFANKARGILETLTGSQAEDLLTRAATDAELYAHLLTRPNATPAEQQRSAAFLKAYLAEIGRRETVRASEEMQEIHERESRARERYQQQLQDVREMTRGQNPLL